MKTAMMVGASAPLAGVVNARSQDGKGDSDVRAALPIA